MQSCGSDLPELPSVLFQHVHHIRHLAIKAALAEHGLSSLGSPLLLFVLARAKEKGLTFTQRELATKLDITPATVAVSLRSLEKGGYVEKNSDPSDGRRNLISLTEKGAAAVDTCMTVFCNVDRTMFQSFSEEEVASFSRLLQKLSADLQSILPKRDTAPCP